MSEGNLGRDLPYFSLAESKCVLLRAHQTDRASSSRDDDGVAILQSTNIEHALQGQSVHAGVGKQ